MTYVLVHGGGSTGRFWDRLSPLLDGDPLAIDLPGRNGRPGALATLSVPDEVTSICSQIASAPVGDPIVLVAHSSGGLVVPGVVATLGDRVVHIVLVAALVPPEGATGLDCMRASHRDGLVAAVEHARAEGTTVTLPGPPGDPESFRTAYGGDPLDDETLAFMIDPSRCVADTVHHYFQPVHWSVATGVPVTYVLTGRDRPVRPQAQEEMVRHLPGPTTVVRIDTGHIPPVTHAAWTAALLSSIGTT